MDRMRGLMAGRPSFRLIAGALLLGAVLFAVRHGLRTRTLTNNDQTRAGSRLPTSGEANPVKEAAAMSEQRRRNDLMSKWPPVGAIAGALLLAVALLGVVYGNWTKTLQINDSTEIGYTNADFIAAETNDPPGTADPGGIGKDIASCTATVVSKHEVSIAIENGYPGYECTFWTTIKNGGTVPERREPLEIDVSPGLLVEELGDLTGVILDPGETDLEKFIVRIQKDVPMNAKLEFKIRKPFSLFVTGTMGFWRNWDSHNTYTQAEIKGWLAEINLAKSWQGPTTTDGLVARINASGGQGATMEDRFLAQCLATWLNVASGRMSVDGLHDVKPADPGSYLGLANPATLAQVQAAIEAKFNTSPTRDQFEIMKDVCDKINNLDLFS